MMRSGTRGIAAGLGAERPLPPTTTLFAFKLANVQKQKLNVLNQNLKLHSGLTLPEGQALSLIQELADELERLNKIDTTLAEESQDKLLINQYRLAIIKAFDEHLRLSTPQKPSAPNPPPIPWWKQTLHYLSYGVLLVVGMVMDGIGSFLGGQELINLIPSIAGPVGMIIGISFSLINAALFYSFEAAMLRQMMGLESMDEIGEQLEMDEEQIVRTKAINDFMMNHAKDSVEQETYYTYAHLAAVINKTIQAKTHFHREELPEKRSHKMLRHAVTLIGGIMVTGSSYFMANSLLLFAAPALVGTPIGWVLLSIGVITMLAYFLSMRGKAMVSMFNPASKKFKDAKAQYEQFLPKSEAVFRQVYKDKLELLTLRAENRELRRQLEVSAGSPRISPPPVSSSPPHSPSLLRGSQGFWRDPQDLSVIATSSSTTELRSSSPGQH